MTPLPFRCGSWLAVVLLMLLGIILETEGRKRAERSHCPWNKNDLVSWGDTAAWANGKVPRFNKTAVIAAGKRVLLDVQPFRIASLTIEEGGLLVWANVPDLELWTDVIVVKGEFYMGSETCRLDQPASIKLTGRHDSINRMPDDENKTKGILVTEGGVLEIHGMKKTSWSHLARTIKPASHYTCGVIYDHSDHKKNLIATERKKGLHVIVWNDDGTLFDFMVFTDYDEEFQTFMDAIPKGKVIGMYAFSSGICCRTDRKPEKMKVLDDIVTALGSKLITQVYEYDAWSMLTIKGDESSTLEHFHKSGRKPENYEAAENYISLPNWKTQRAFQVAKSGNTDLQYFRVLTTDIAYPILELADPIINWNAGDKIVVASTDFDFEQAEVKEVIDCKECTESQVRVNEPFLYTHFGNFTYNVDERAEVGLLSRNILIEGIMDEVCDAYDRPAKKRCQRFGGDTFGGHIKFERGHKQARVEGVELFHMGQQGFLGSYPLHFHMCDEARGSWVRDNSIHHSFQRCVTIHGTDWTEVSGNVCYEHLGHGYFLEDSVEQNNIIANNLGLGTRHGGTLMSDSDRDWCDEDYGIDKGFSENCGDVSTFWLTHPNNIVTGNAAAGGVVHGFMYVFADMPLGLSYARQQLLGKVKNDTARHTAIKKFYKNAAHSYRRSGIFIDSHISTGRLGLAEDNVPENGILQEENYYEPRDPPGDPNGQRVWDSKIERFTAYKNLQNNMWVKGGNINATFCSMADAGLQSFSGGCTGFWTGVSLEYSVVIGKTDNKGEPKLWIDKETGLRHQFDHSVGKSPWQTMMGVAIYQGPMYVKHSYFDQFYTSYWNDTWEDITGKRPVKNAGGISFKRDSNYPTYTSQYTTNLTFGYCDNENDAHWLYFGNPTVYDWTDRDGPKQAYNEDRDGSLTGTSKTAIVRNRPFHTGPECAYREDWDMSTCPYKYIKFELLGKGEDAGSLDFAGKSNWALTVYREDEPNDPFLNAGAQRCEYLARTFKSYLIDYNTSLPNAAFTRDLKFQGNGVETMDVIRVGMCVPLDLTDFEIKSTYPLRINRNNYTRANNLAELDAIEKDTAVFHDTKNGIIFFKIWSLHDRTNDSQLCPAGNCFNLRIVMNNGNLTKMRTCFGNTHYPAWNDERANAYKPVKLKTDCRTLGTPEGIGATQWDEVPKIVTDDYSVPCPDPNAVIDPLRKEQVWQGCFLQEEEDFVAPVRLANSMTIDYCTKRCYMRGVVYAALTAGSTCLCGNELEDTEAARDIRSRECTQTCSGDSNQECGHNSRLSVWTTGL